MPEGNGAQVITFNGKFQRMVRMGLVIPGILYSITRGAGGKSTCLALCYNFLCGDIGFVYPAMSMVVIGPSLLY
jgi:hypothetical protein